MIPLKGIYATAKWYQKVCLLLFMVVFGLVFSSSLLFILQKLTHANDTNAWWMLFEQTIAATMTFLGSTFAYTYLTKSNPLAYLGLLKKGRIRLYLIATMALWFMMPVVNISTYWNEQLTLPASLQSIETLMRQMEDAAKEATLIMLSPNGIVGWLSVVFVVAFLAAACEELLFRGCIQKGIANKTGNKHIAVWCTAMVFSFIHFQFYGFIPRLILGVVLGYFYAYSGSIRIPIWAHFLNNFLSIVYYKVVVIPSTQLYENSNIKIIPADSETAGIIGELDQKVANSMEDMMLYAAGICLALYVLSMLLFVFVARNRKPQ